MIKRISVGFLRYFFYKILLWGLGYSFLGKRIDSSRFLSKECLALAYLFDWRNDYAPFCVVLYYYILLKKKAPYTLSGQMGLTTEYLNYCTWSFCAKKSKQTLILFQCFTCTSNLNLLKTFIALKLLFCCMKVWLLLNKKT